MVNLKLKKSLAKENYVNQLVIKGTCQIKEIVDYENQKTNPQLIQDLMNFIQNEIAESKYTKKDSDFDKPKILEDILISVYSNLDDSEKIWLEKQIQHIIDNKLVKKNPFIKRLQFIKKNSYYIIKTSIKLINYSIKIIFNERVQKTIPILGQIPFHGITSLNQLIVYGIGAEIGLEMKVIMIILLFL